MLCSPRFLEIERCWTLGYQITALSDNTGAESVCNNLYTSKVPLNLCVRKLSMWSSITGISLDCSHISGEKNDDADLLSRWDGSSTLPAKFCPQNRYQISLEEFWNISFNVSLFPKDTFLLWDLPAQHTLGPADMGSKKRKWTMLFACYLHLTFPLGLSIVLRGFGLPVSCPGFYDCSVAPAFKLRQARRSGRGTPKL